MTYDPHNLGKSGFIDVLGDNGEVGCVDVFRAGMELLVLAADDKHERGTVIVKNVHTGTAGSTCRLEFEEALPKGTRKGDFLVYV